MGDDLGPPVRQGTAVDREKPVGGYRHLSASCWYPRRRIGQAHQLARTPEPEPRVDHQRRYLPYDTEQQSDLALANVGVHVDERAGE